MSSPYGRCKTYKLYLRIVLTCMLCVGYPITYAKYAVTQQDIDEYDNTARIYPLSLQLNNHFGILLPIPLYDVVQRNSLYDRMLLTLGVRADIGLLYARRWLWEHFDCYPKIGFLLKYDFILNNNIAEKGYMVGGVFYIEPNYNHLDGWEILPRAGVGIAYLNIPGGFSFFKKRRRDGSKDVTPYSSAGIDPLRKELDLNIIFDMMIKYRLTPNWHLHFSLGVDYFPALFTKQGDTNSFPIFNKTIEIYTASLGCSYTFNPSTYNPPRRNRFPQNWIDVSFLNSFRKAYIGKKNTNPSQYYQQDYTNKYYYIGGLQVQWSHQVVNNHAIVVGSEWIKDWALKKELEEKVIKDNLLVSFMVGHEFIWSRINFGQYLGYYVFNKPNVDNKPFVVNDLFYLRLGLKYRITEYLHVGTSLKIAMFPASKGKKVDKNNKPILEYAGLEFLDIRIGYTF